MRKYIHLIAVSAVAIGLLTAPSSLASTSAPHLGGSCAKNGLQSNTSSLHLVCIKSGKKLIWQISNKSDSKQSNSTTSHSYKALNPIKLPVSPVSTITFANILDHISEIPTVSYQNIQKVVAANAPVTLPTSIYVGPTTTLDIVGGVPRINEILGKETQLWNGFAFPTHYSIYLYNSADEKTTENKFSEDFKAKGYDSSSPETLAGPLRAMAGNCQKQIHPGAFSGEVTTCTGANSGSYFNSTDSFMQLGQSGDNKTANFNDGVVIGHEFDHAMQGAQWIGSPNCVNPDNFASGCNRSGMSNHGFSPCWLFEGQPNAIGSALAENSLESYIKFRNTLPYGWGPTTVTDYTQPSLLNYLTTMQSPSECYKNGPLYNLGYSIGALTTEALIAIGGPQATMALFAQGANGDDFAAAFQHVYGISWADAASTLSKVLAAEYSTYGPPPK